MKKISISVGALTILLSSGCFAVDYTTKAVKPKTFGGTLEQYYPLEIELKDNDSVKVRVMSDSKYADKKIHELTLGQAKVARLNYKEIDVNAPLDIELSVDSAKKKYKTTYKVNPNGNTVYLKIENGKLAPRVGSTFGSKTPSGLSIKNNIPQSRVRVI